MNKARAWLVALLTLSVVLLGILGAVGMMRLGAFSTTASATPVLYDEGAMVALYESVSPAVVEINVTKSISTGFRFAPTQQGVGSGFLVDEEGHILTNYHGVQGATRIHLTLADGRTLDAQVTGTSPADDLALLKIDPKELNGIAPLTLGDSSTAKPGQMAIALGSPFGLEGSITVGVVSGVNRSLPSSLGRPITGMLQTDASINPGNSGGPLLNSQGEVVGINTALEGSSDGTSTRVGLAVPINTAKNFLTQSKQNSTVKKPWLGISDIALSPDIAESLNLKITRGIYVVTVVPNSPAAAAGLRGASASVGGSPSSGGDVITAAEGRALKTVEDLVTFFNSRQPGDRVDLTIVRSGESQHITVTLGEWPGS